MCNRLNEHYKTCAASQEIQARIKTTRDCWGSTVRRYQWFLNDKDLNLTTYSTKLIERYNSMTCCGVGEMLFSSLIHQNLAELDEIGLDLFIAKAIKSSLSSDDRVYFCGLPVTGGKLTAKNYKLICESLLRFGATELTDKPYRNRNTGRMIRVFAFRKPSQSAKNATL